MKIKNFDQPQEAGAKSTSPYPFMPQDCFTMLMAGPRGCGKTNTLCMMLTEPMIPYDRLYVYTRNLHQPKFKMLQQWFANVGTDPEWPSSEAPAYFSSSSIIPLSSLSENLVKVVVFDDFLEASNDKKRIISEYFTQGRHKKCSVIYLSQSYYRSRKDVRLNTTHFCIFAIPSSRERSSILHDIGVSKEQYNAATANAHDFLYIDKVRNTVAKISMSMCSASPPAYCIAAAMAYIPYHIALTEKQKQTLSAAYHNKASAAIHLTYAQLTSEGDVLGLTQTQKNRIEKAKLAQKGVRLLLSPSQISKQGGFLGPLLLNAAKAVFPAVGISALQSAASALVDKAIKGSGCNYGMYAKKAAPQLIKELTPAQQKRALAEVKEGGFLLPLLAAAASSIIPAVIDLVRGKGYQVKPNAGSGYQVKPPPPKNFSSTP